MARKAGMASSSFDQLIFVTGCTINTPTSTSAGAVAMAGTIDNSGAKNKKGKNNNAPVIAVRPVLPPSFIPTADSIYAVPGLEPTNPARVVATASVINARFILRGSPFSSSRLAASDNPTNVERLSNISVNTKAKITGTTDQCNEF